MERRFRAARAGSGKLKPERGQRTAARRKRVVQILDAAKDDSEEQPVYAAEGKGGPGTIAHETGLRRSRVVCVSASWKQ